MVDVLLAACTAGHHLAESVENNLAGSVGRVLAGSVEMNLAGSVGKAWV